MVSIIRSDEFELKRMYQIIYIGLAFLAVGFADAQRASTTTRSFYKVKDVKIDENYVNITTGISRSETDQKPSLASVMENIEMDLMRRMNNSFRAYRLFPPAYIAFQYPSNSTGYKGLTINPAYSLGFSVERPPSNATYVTTTTPLPENVTTTEAPSTTNSPTGAQQFPNSQRNTSAQQSSNNTQGRGTSNNQQGLRSNSQTQFTNLQNANASRQQGNRNQQNSPISPNPYENRRTSSTQFANRFQQALSGNQPALSSNNRQQQGFRNNGQSNRRNSFAFQRNTTPNPGIGFHNHLNGNRANNNAPQISTPTSVFHFAHHSTNIKESHDPIVHSSTISYPHIAKLDPTPEVNYKDQSGYHYGNRRGVFFEKK